PSLYRREISELQDANAANANLCDDSRASRGFPEVRQGPVHPGDPHPPASPPSTASPAARCCGAKTYFSEQTDGKRMPHIRVARTAPYEVLGSEKTAREIWFVLHGYGQLASSFIRAFAPLDDGTRLIVAPEALNRFYLVNVDSAPPVERPEIEAVECF